MTDQMAVTESAVHRARQLLERDTEKRLAAVQTLANAVVAADDAERAASEAKAAHERAWVDALSAGWSEKDLRATGARPPGAVRSSRGPRRPKADAAPSAASGHGNH